MNCRECVQSTVSASPLDGPCLEHAVRLLLDRGVDLANLLDEGCKKGGPLNP
jgi:hypothetical protein